MSDRPCLTFSPDGWVQVSRQEWEEIHSELSHLRSMLGGAGEIGEIIRAASKVGGVRVQDILGRCRSASLVRIRFAIFVVARGMEIDSKSIISALHRRRTLDLYYERISTHELETNAKFRDLVKRLEAACC